MSDQPAPAPAEPGAREPIRDDDSPSVIAFRMGVALGRIEARLDGLLDRYDTKPGDLDPEAANATKEN